MFVFPVFADLSNPCYHYNMTSAKERILLVENNLKIADIIARQTLQPMGYQVEIARTAGTAIQFALRNTPDLILADLDLPELSGKDLLAALSSQVMGTPVIVIAEKDSEGDILQAFRLGATDYLQHPVRETEVLAAVERALVQVRGKREREMLAVQLQQTNQELQQRIRELTTIFAIGKAVTSITDQQALLEKLMEAAVFVTDADLGWILLKDDQIHSFLLSAGRNLPERLAHQVNKAWDDGISSLVAISKESLLIHGDALKRFPIKALGAAALLVPIKAKQEVIGMVIVMRKANQPFNPENRILLESLADYASISLANAKLFKHLKNQTQVLERYADTARIGEQIKADLFRQTGREISAPLISALDQIMALMGGHIGKLTADQDEALRVTSEQLGYIIGLADSLEGHQEHYFNAKKGEYDLNSAAREAMARFQGITMQRGIVLESQLSAKPLKVFGSLPHLTRVFESLISNALKFSPKGNRVKVTSELLDQSGKCWAHASVQDSGLGMTQEQLSQIFEGGTRGSQAETLGYGGLGIRLPLAREIVRLHGGKLWMNSEIHKGSTAHLLLPSILIH
jgi:signal transduction histidine kinase